MNGTEASKFRLATFLLRPSNETAKQALNLEALKLNYLQQAGKDTLLYSDQKVAAPFPWGIDPVHVALRGHAHAIAHEGVYRAFVTGAGSLTQLSKAIGNSRKDFRVAARLFFSLVASALSDKVDRAKLAKFGGSTDSLAESFVKFEELKRESILREVISHSSMFLTEVPLQDLKDAIADAAKVEVLSLARLFVMSGLLETKKAEGEADLTPSQDELQVLTLAMSSFSDSAIEEDSIPNAVWESFDRSRHDFELMTSMKRYAFASWAIQGAEVLKKTLDLIKQIEIFTRDEGHKVPIDMTPKHPDPAMVMIALKQKDAPTAEEKKPSDDAPPTWVLDMIHAVGNVSEKSDQPSENDPTALSEASRSLKRDLRIYLKLLPVKMQQELKTMKSVRNDVVFDDIYKANEQLKSTHAYVWSSFDLKLKSISTAVKHDSSKTFVKAFIEFKKYVDWSQSDDLKTKVRSVFDFIIAEKRNFFHGELYDRFNELSREIDRGKNFVDAESIFISNLLGRPKERTLYLREQLQDAKVYIAYLTAYVQSLESSSPLLFMPLKPPTAISDELKPDQPIKFWELVIKLESALRVTHSADIVGLDVMRDLRRLAPAAKTPELLKQPVGVASGPGRGEFLRTILRDALGNVQRENLIDKYGRVDTYINMIYGEGEGSQVDDRHWPTQLLVRDALPALFDPSSMATKMKRMVISALLEPYLMASAKASANEQTLLLDTKVDKSKLLVSSSAFQLLLAEAGEEYFDGLSELEKYTLRWRKRTEDYKKFTTKLQEISGEVFNLTFFVEVTPVGQMVGAMYMAAASFLDFGADAAMLVDYISAYSGMRDYRAGGAFGSGLFSVKDIDDMHDRFDGVVTAIASRAVMDFAFYGQMLPLGPQVMRSMTNMARFAANIRKFSAAAEAAGYEASAFRKDYLKLVLAYNKLGMPYSVHPVLFELQYAHVEVQVEPELKKNNEQVIAGWKTWTDAKKVTDDFYTKYPASAEFLFSTPEGNGKEKLNVPNPLLVGIDHTLRKMKSGLEKKKKSKKSSENSDENK
jgi:hypothetical protein